MECQDLHTFYIKVLTQTYYTKTKMLTNFRSCLVHKFLELFNWITCTAKLLQNRWLNVQYFLSMYVYLHKPGGWGVRDAHNLIKAAPRSSFGCRPTSSETTCYRVHLQETFFFSFPLCRSSLEAEYRRGDGSMTPGVGICSPSCPQRLPCVQSRLFTYVRSRALSWDPLPSTTSIESETGLFWMQPDQAGCDAHSVSVW